MTAQWQRLVDHVMSIPEQVYETWNSSVGWDNHTKFGKEFGWDGVPWCAIFDWDMYNDCGLSGIVPKTASVSAMAAWAQRNGQWSEYPSIGAWVDFGDGAHTEIVVGFDADTVYTKGGNSIKAGASDSGQGNGVWSHATARRSSRVTGYFAPKFSDGICPPTADPHDYRGGKAVTSWRWSAPVAPPKPPAVPVFPGRNYFKNGAVNQYVTQLGKRLVAKGYGKHYTSGPGPRWTEADRLNVRDFQLAHKELKGDADGYPGPLTWKILFS
jgi:hypothetical protein